VSGLKDINLVYLDIPQEYLLEINIQFWPSAFPEANELVWITLATHESLHCLQSGRDYSSAFNPHDLYLWDEPFCLCRPDKSGLVCDGACVNWGL
jgi:hypothetical protein